jgi:dCMP deaminase
MDPRAHLLGFAEHAAKASRDPSTQVGAALISPDGDVLLTACNDFPVGVQDHPERRSRPTKYLFTSHAEGRLIAHAAKHGIKTAGMTVYVTHFPCSRCASTLIDAGISLIVHGTGSTSMPPEEFDAAIDMFCEAGIDLEVL